jgi:hypothetical protein
LSVESFGFKFVVDAKDAAKGYGDFQKAVDGVFASLTQFESHAKKVMDNVTSSSRKGQTDIAKYASQFKALANIPVDSRAAPALLKLSDAMARFKAPNTTQIANMRSFFRNLGTLPDLSATTRSISNIAKLSAAMNGFKAPSAGQAEKLVVFAKALQQVGPGLASLEQSCRCVRSRERACLHLHCTAAPQGSIGFAGCKPAELRSSFADDAESADTAICRRMLAVAVVRSTASRLRALHRPATSSSSSTRSTALKVPANAGQIADYLTTDRGCGEFRERQSQELPRFAEQRLVGFVQQRRRHKARLEMMGLQNAFSGTFQVGSLLRSMLGSLTIGELGREFFNATQAANQFHATMEVLGQSPMMQASGVGAGPCRRQQLRCRPSTSYSDNFSKFAVAAHESGMQLGEAFKVYEGFQTVSTALHLGKEQQNSVGLAIREIMDQGYVSTSRLTRQLGLVLPGALSTLQKAWKESGTPGITLFDALKKKMVDGQWALDTLSKHYTQVYGPAVKAALESPIQQWNILKNNIHETMIEIGNDGAKKAFADLIAKLSGGLDPEHMHKFAQSISDGLVKALHKAGDAVDWLKAHWSQIKGPLGEVLSLLGKWMVISASLQISKAIVSPLADTYSMLVRVAPKMKEFILLMRGMATMNVATPLASGGGAALSGGMLTTLNAVNKLKLAMKSMTFTDVFASIRAGFASLNAPITGLGATALSVGAAIAAGLAGGFMAGATAAHESGIKMQSDQYSTVEIIKGMWMDATAHIGKLMHWLGGLIAEAWDGVVHYTGIAFGAVGSIVSNVLIGIAYGFKTLVSGIADLFVALAKSVSNTLGTMASAGSNMLSGNFAAAGSDALKLLTFKGVRDGFSAAFKDFGGGGYSKFKSDTGKGFAYLFDDSLTKWGKMGRGKTGGGGTPQPKVTPYSVPTPDITDPIYHGNGDGTGTKKKKGKDQAAALRSQENEISGLMKDLMEEDPYGKLFSDFVDKITKEGEVLLNNKAFKAYVQNIQADAATGKVSVDALVHALQAGGIKPKVLDDLKKRYHTDVAGVIKMLQSQQAAYENSVKEATLKAIKAQDQATNDILKRLAEDNPLLKIMQDFSDDLENEAMKLLNKDAFKTWLDQTANSADGAATATQRLIAALRDANNITPGVIQGLARRGMSVDKDIIPNLNNSNNFKDINLANKKEELAVGQQLLQQGQQELALASMTDRQQSVANKLLEEFNRQKALKHIMSQQEITDLQRNLELQSKNLQLMQQQKEYYENNGIKKYLGDIQTAGEFVHQLDNDALKGLEDTLYQLGTTGKLSFKSLVDGLQSDIIRFASQNLVKSFVGLLNPNAANEKDPTIFGMFGKMLGGSTGFTPPNSSIIQESYATPMQVNVVNGNMLFGQGGFGGGAGGGLGGGSLLDPNDPLGLKNSNMLDGNKSNSIPGSIGGSITDAVSGAQPAIQNSFMTTFKGLAMSLGPLLGGAIGSAVGGKWGGVIGTVASIGMMFLTKGMSGGAPMGVPGGLEGGITGSLVNRYMVQPSAFMGAPHYAEGTPNTSGGHPAILHDNEAVIPLSRGRKVPVELTGMSSNANGGVTVHNNFTINSPDADSFRKSKQQIATDLHAAGARSWQRNN